jgi:hypothetical protein
MKNAIIILSILFTFNLFAAEECGRIIVSAKHPLTIQELEANQIFNYFFEDEITPQEGDIKIKVKLFPNTRVRLEGKLQKLSNNSFQTSYRVPIKQNQKNKSLKHYRYDQYQNERRFILNKIITHIKQHCSNYND